MAEEPDNLVLVQLREIRAKLDKLDKIEADVSTLTTQLEGVAEATYVGVGLATMANHKFDRLTDRFDAIDRRLQKVEGAPAP